MWLTMSQLTYLMISYSFPMSPIEMGGSCICLYHQREYFVDPPQLLQSLSLTLQANVLLMVRFFMVLVGDARVMAAAGKKVLRSSSMCLKMMTRSCFKLTTATCSTRCASIYRSITIIESTLFVVSRKTRIMFCFISHEILPILFTTDVSF